MSKYDSRRSVLDYLVQKSGVNTTLTSGAASATSTTTMHADAIAASNVLVYNRAPQIESFLEALKPLKERVASVTAHHMPTSVDTTEDL